jgi:hypothetical protein
MPKNGQVPYARAPLDNVKVSVPVEVSIWDSTAAVYKDPQDSFVTHGEYSRNEGLAEPRPWSDQT